MASIASPSWTPFSSRLIRETSSLSSTARASHTNMQVRRPVLTRDPMRAQSHAPSAKPLLSLPPHPFGAAELILRFMREQGKDQSIIFRFVFRHDDASRLIAAQRWGWLRQNHGPSRDVALLAVAVGAVYPHGTDDPRGIHCCRRTVPRTHEPHHRPRGAIGERMAHRCFLQSFSCARGGPEKDSSRMLKATELFYDSRHVIMGARIRCCMHPVDIQFYSVPDMPSTP